MLNSITQQFKSLNKSKKKTEIYIFRGLFFFLLILEL